MSGRAWRCSGTVCAKLAGGPAVRQPCGDTRSGVGRCVCWQRSVLSCPCTCQLALAACFLWAGALENCAVGPLAVSSACQELLECAVYEWVPFCMCGQCLEVERIDESLHTVSLISVYCEVVLYLAVCEVALLSTIVGSFSAADVCCKERNFMSNGFSMLTCIGAAAPVAAQSGRTIQQCCNPKPVLACFAAHQHKFPLALSAHTLRCFHGWTYTLPRFEESSIAAVIRLYSSVTCSMRVG
jgi:hypothetical protein